MFLGIFEQLSNARKGLRFEDNVNTHVRETAFESGQKDRKQKKLNSEIGS